MNEPAGSLFSDVDGSGASDEAARYLTFAAERAADMRRQGYERMEVGEGCSVLDVGCGLGEVCADLVELVGPSGRVVGVDVFRGHDYSGSGTMRRLANRVRYR